MITTLLCDVDGVLAVGEPFSRRLAREYALPAHATAAFFRGRFMDCLIGKGDLKDELAGHLPVWGWPRSVDNFLAYWFDSENVVNAPLLELIQGYRRHGLRCYLATNQERYRTAYIWERMGFAEHFDGIFSSAYKGSMKHDPVFFAQALAQLQARPENVLFWDDSPANVAVARTAGLLAECYRDVTNFAETMREHLKQS